MLRFFRNSVFFTSCAFTHSFLPWAFLSVRQRHDLLFRGLFLARHFALAVKENPLFDDELGRLDIALDRTGREDVYLLARVNIAEDLAAADKRADGDLAVEVRAVSGDQGVLGNDLSIHFSVHAYGPFEAEHAFKFRALSQKCRDLRLIRCACTLLQHEPSLNNIKYVEPRIDTN